MLTRDTARPEIWSSGWPDGLVNVKQTLDWLRLFYDVYEASEFWTQAEIDAPDSSAPSGATAGDAKDSNAPSHAAAGLPKDYDPKIESVLDTAVDLVEYHSGISLFDEVDWSWTVDVVKGPLYSYSRWITLQCPVSPVSSVEEIRVFDPSVDVAGRSDHMVLVESDEYILRGNDILVSKNWTYRSPGKFDMYNVKFTTELYSDLRILNNAILKLAAYIYEHAGDEFQSGDAVIESGALALISRHFRAEETIFSI